MRRLLAAVVILGILGTGCISLQTMSDKELLLSYGMMTHDPLWGVFTADSQAARNYRAELEVRGYQCGPMQCEHPDGRHLRH